MVPSDFAIEALVAVAGVDPRSIADLVRSGDTSAITLMAAGFRAAAAQAAAVARQGRDADTATATAYTNERAAVFDAEGSTREGRVLLADDGELMTEVAGVLDAVGGGLDEAIRDVDLELDRLAMDVDAVITARNAFHTSAPGLSAEDRDAVDRGYVAEAAERVRDRARSIQAVVDGYDRLLASRIGHLGEFGYTVPPLDSEDTGGLNEFLGDAVSELGAVVSDTAGKVWDLLPVRGIWEPNEYTDDLVRYAGGAVDSVGALINDPVGTLLAAGKDTIGWNHWANGEPGRAVGQITGEVLLGGAVGRLLKGLRGHPDGVSVPAAVRPEVADPRLRNFVDSVYRGVDNPARVGDGTTADALRHERATGTDVHGRSHERKAREIVRGLNNWLRRNPDAAPSDRAAAETMRDDLLDALNS